VKLLLYFLHRHAFCIDEICKQISIDTGIGGEVSNISAVTTAVFSDPHNECNASRDHSQDPIITIHSRIEWISTQ